MILAVSLCDGQSNCVPWRMVEDHINSTLKDIIANLYAIAFDTDEFAFVLSYLLGILRVIKNSFLLEGCASKIKKRYPKKLYPLCY